MDYSIETRYNVQQGDEWHPAFRPCAICQQPGYTLHQDKVLCADCESRVAAYQGRVESRLERMRARATKAASTAQADIDRAHNMAQAIPFGQPILVGHHSEGRDRRYRERIEKTFRRGVAQLQKAQRIAERAEAAESNRAVSSDDPAAILKLTEKLARLEADQARFKQINAAIRSISKKTDDAAERARMLADELSIEPPAAVAYWQPDDLRRVGIPDYQITNNGAEIRRVKARIAGLQAKEAKRAAAPDSASEEFHGEIRLIRDLDDNRLRLVFPGKPEAEIIATLKAHGFRWSPSNKAWQRQLNNGAEYAASVVIKKANG